MENYKGFLIDQRSEKKEVMTFFGNTMQGTGVFVNEWVTYLIDPTSAKSIIVKNMDEAKRLVDQWFTPEAIQKLVDLDKQIEERRKVVTDLQDQLSNYVTKAKSHIDLETQKLNVLQGTRPPEFK